MSNETLILILYILLSLTTGTIFGLLDSRDFWKSKYKELIENEKNITR